MFKNSILKKDIRKMRKAVLAALLTSKGAKFLHVDIDQQILLGKTDEEIYDHLISQQTLMFRVRGRFHLLFNRKNRNPN